MVDTTEDSEAICVKIQKIEQLAPCTDGRREKKVHVASAESAKRIFGGVCGYCKKRAGQSARIALNTKPNKVDLNLHLGRNVACA
jgi:hypothetical protein